MNNSLVDKNSTSVTREEIYSGDSTVFQLSDIRNFKIYRKDKAYMRGSTTLLNIPHNLGSVPAHLIFVKGSGLPTGNNNVPYFVNDGINNFRVEMAISDKNIEFVRNFTTFDIEISFILYNPLIAI